MQRSHTLLRRGSPGVSGLLLLLRPSHASSTVPHHSERLLCFPSFSMAPLDLVDAPAEKDDHLRDGVGLDREHAVPPVPQVRRASLWGVLPRPPLACCTGVWPQASLQSLSSWNLFNRRASLRKLSKTGADKLERARAPTPPPSGQTPRPPAAPWPLPGPRLGRRQFGPRANHFLQLRGLASKRIRHTAPGAPADPTAAATAALALQPREAGGGASAHNAPHANPPCNRGFSSMRYSLNHRSS